MGYKQCMKHTITLCLALLLSATSFSQSPSSPKNQTTRILFLLDASGSMYARMGDDTRINVAKRLLSRMSDSLSSLTDVEIALRVYGHQYDKQRQVCTDTKLEVGFAKDNHEEIKERIKDIRPKGTTLIAYSLQEAAYDFPSNVNCRNIIILITDGLEECDGDPCAVSQALQKQGVILKPFIIGIGMEGDFKKQFECIGKYFEANTEEAFEKVLDVVVAQALNNTTCQVNLLDKFGKPTETDVNISFYDATTKEFLTNVVHTMNDKGVPDTIYLDPAHNYDILVHTIPPVRKNNVEILPGKHTVVDIPAPQGSLHLDVDGITGYNRLNAIITKQGSCEILHMQQFNTIEPYIIGTYDLEILTLPRIRYEGIKIEQSKITTLKVHQPGKLNMITRVPFVGDIYRIKGGDYEWVCNVDIKENTVFTLQPGEYAVVARKTKEVNMINSREQTVEVISGKTTNITL
ncbi:MAG: VWA domain-containing protein [Bacteroidetes bacterium]|nr:VWA domain-containing protein [Bacteroidota bacterium]